MGKCPKKGEKLAYHAQAATDQRGNLRRGFPEEKKVTGVPVCAVASHLTEGA